MVRHPWLQQLLDLQLPPDDYALFGSGPLLARGWIDQASDLDVVARGAAWKKARALGRQIHLKEHGVDVIAIGDHITIGNRWAIGQFSIDQLIDQAECIAGVPCAPLRYVIEYKRLAGRPKDREHLERIEQQLEPRSE